MDPWHCETGILSEYSWTIAQPWKADMECMPLKIHNMVVVKHQALSG